MREGSTIGRYRIERLLGAGGMGSVYRAFDLTLQRRVALKVLLADATHDEPSTRDAKGRLLREARSAAALHHPNAVAIFDVGEHEGTPFIAMELVAGRSLRQLLHDEEIGWQERLRWLTDVGRALSAAHAAGIVHRDIKPDNVMLSDGGVVKVLDFGIARRANVGVDPSAATELEGLGTITAKGGVIGTPLYMAPEQVRGEEVDARADQFAWGVLGWELLSGSPPWKPTSMIALVAAITSAEPPALALPEGCPPSIETVLRRALAKSPADRYESFEDALAALAIAATKNASPLASTVEGVIEPSPPRARRSVTRKVALLGALAAAGGLAVLGARGLDRSRAAEDHLPASASASASASPSPSVATRIIDLPAPASSRSEAVAAYRTGVQAMRDASWKLADESFARATTLDPEMALAHLRASLTARSSRPSEVRRHFARATELRHSLSPRDRAFMIALEPLLVRDPPDAVESSKRLADAAAKFPDDAELAGLHGFIGRPVFGNAAALAAARKSVALDPEYADAWNLVGDIAADLGDLDEARKALQRCVEISPASIDCRAHLAMIDELDGKCVAVEAALRNLIQMHSESAATLYPFWPSALVAVGREREAVQAALEQRWSRLPETHRDVMRLVESSRLETFYGDFPAALRKVADLERAVASSTDGREHGIATALRIELEEETGRPSDAARSASTYLKKRDAWSAIVDDPDPTPHILYAARRGGLLDEGAFESARKGWGAPTHAEARPGSWWARAYGAAETEREAGEAIAALPPAGPPKSYFRHPTEAAGVGRILLLSGRAQESIPVLHVAAQSCAQLIDPVGHTRANELLGRALETTGDVSGACAAYDAVRARWGNASASVTFQRARARWDALHCAAKRR